MLLIAMISTFVAAGTVQDLDESFENGAQFVEEAAVLDEESLLFQDEESQEMAFAEEDELEDSPEVAVLE